MCLCWPLPAAAVPSCATQTYANHVVAGAAARALALAMAVAMFCMTSTDSGTISRENEHGEKNRNFTWSIIWIVFFLRSKQTK